jgi:hypothetical protein
MKTKGQRFEVKGITADVYREGVQLHTGGVIENWPPQAFDADNTDEEGYPALLLRTGYVESRQMGEGLGSFVARVGKHVAPIVG